MARRRLLRSVALLLVGLNPWPAHAASPPQPAVQWRQAMPGWGQPAADESMVFVLTRQHEVAALDLTTGDVRWRAHTGGAGDAPLGSTVRLAGSRVIVGDDAVVAFDRATGRTAWRFVPASGHGAGIFLGDSSGGLIVAGSTSGHVYALDAAAGTLRWTRQLTRAGTVAVHPPVVAGGRVIAAFTRFDRPLSGGLAAFDSNGVLLWRRRLPSGSGAAGGVTIDGTTAIVAATDGTIRGFSIVNGSPRWTLPPKHAPGSGPASGRDIRPLARTGRVLVVGSLDGELLAYDLDTRRPLWRYADGPDGAAALRLSADATHVYAPYTDGSLVAVALDSGRERWRTASTADVLEWPPLARGQQLVAAGGAAVVALSLAVAAPDAAGDTTTRRNDD